MATNFINALYSRNISVTFCQNICSEIEIKAYFHFPHYKSMETFKLPYRPKQMSTAIKT